MRMCVWCLLCAAQAVALVEALSSWTVYTWISLATSVRTVVLVRVASYAMVHLPTYVTMHHASCLVSCQVRRHQRAVEGQVVPWLYDRCATLPGKAC